MPGMRFADAPVFAGCPRSERELLQSMAIPLRVRAGEPIVKQGDFGSAVGVIVFGRATVWKDGQRVAELGPGDCYGEMALVLAPGEGGGHRSATVRADTDVRVETIAAWELNRSLSDLPFVADALRGLAAQHRHIAL